MQHATAKSAVESRPMPAPEPAKGVLLPGFTAVNNSYYLTIQNKLTLAELRLLNVIIYYTNGYLRRWCIIGEEALCRHANIARSTLYETKKSLEAQGLIKISRTRWCCRYALGDRLGVLADVDTPSGPSKSPQPPQQNTPLKSTLVDPNPSDHVDSCREAQDNLDQQHARQVPPATEPPTGDDDLLKVFEDLERGWKEPRGLSSDQQEPAARSAEFGRLVNQLLELGVHERVAQRLANTQTREVIASAIARLPKVNTQNPAGYLVAEISRGGYKEPDRTKPLRVYHDEIHEKRKAERDQEAEAKEQSSRATADALDRYAQLPSDHQAELTAALHRQAHVDGFTRLSGWSESHPLYRGLLAELVADWITRNNMEHGKDSCKKCT